MMIHHLKILDAILSVIKTLLSTPIRPPLQGLCKASHMMKFVGGKLNGEKSKYVLGVVFLRQVKKSSQ